MRTAGLVSPALVLALFAAAPAFTQAPGDTLELSADEVATLLGDPYVAYHSPWAVTVADFETIGPFNGCGQGNGFPVVTTAFLFGPECVAKAPVHLPDGVTVNSAVFYLYDNAGTDLTPTLRRKRVNNLVDSSVMGTVTTSGAVASVRIFADVTITDPVINNASYTYYVDTGGLNEGHRIYAVLISYTE